MNRVLIALVSVTMLFCTTVAQPIGRLVINPKLMGGLGGFPVTHFSDGYWLKRDERSGTYVVPKLPPRKSLRPDELLIVGAVPDIHKRWAIVLTHSEVELYQKLNEYRELKARGEKTHPRKIMYIKNISVATKVTSFFGGVKVKEMPEKAGSFFLTISPRAMDRFGHIITFISHSPEEGGDIVDVGDDFGEEINGMLSISESVNPEDSSITYKMNVIEAKLTEENLKEQIYVVKKSHN